MRKGQKHARRTTFNRPTRHSTAPVPKARRAKAEPRDPFRWTKRLLNGLKRGGRLVHAIGRGWQIVFASGHRFNVKRKHVLAALRQRFVSFRLTLTFEGACALAAL